MRRVLLMLVLVLPGCWNSDSENVTTIWATQTSGSGVSSSAGGGIVQITGLHVPAFVFDEPMAFGEELPAPDGLAMADAQALAAPDAVVIDALYTVDGLLGLVRLPDGPIVTLLAAEPPLRTAAPLEAFRLLPAGDDPLRVLVVLADGRAMLATRTSSE